MGCVRWFMVFVWVGASGFVDLWLRVPIVVKRDAMHYRGYKLLSCGVCR